MINKILTELQNLEQTEAIALGGSRAGSAYDDKSDYDVYLYCKGKIDENRRRQILEQYCSAAEIGNHFWEYEDNCTMSNGIDLDIIYRDLDDFITGIAEVVEKCVPHNGYTTCMWHNLITSKIIYDRDGRLTEYQKQYSTAYPRQLKQHIIAHNMRLLKNALPAYCTQIEKAVRRKDFVSINHRVAEFMASYFDILFAMNELTHPGEKRLVAICKRECRILPHHFEENITALYQSMFLDGEQALRVLNEMIKALERCLSAEPEK